MNDSSEQAKTNRAPTGRLKLGWAQGDITPDQPVALAGQFPCRVSEGVENPLTVTALALEGEDDHAVLVSCDVGMIPDELRDRVRSRVASDASRARGLDPMKIVIHATHTHTAMELRLPGEHQMGVGSAGNGVEVGVMATEKSVDMVADRIADAAARAWADRRPGGIAYGLGQAVVGHNRRWVDDRGRSTMYRLHDQLEFRHIEGYEDHSLAVLGAYDQRDQLTGVVVNVPCPSQVTEHHFTLSADYWHETRQRLRQRLGAGLFVLGQCGAAGDQSPRPMVEKRAHQRMLKLRGRTQREEIARRIADAVEATLAPIAGAIEKSPPLSHAVMTMDLPMTRLTEADARSASAEARKWEAKYEREKARLDADPSLRDQPRWYLPVTEAFRRMKWHEGVVTRHQRQTANPVTPAEAHALRLGEAAMASVPFEYYLDFGTRIKVRSPAVQNFLVQLAGGGTYLPSERATAGGGYGSVPGSARVGPEAGQLLVETIVEALRRQWPREQPNSDAPGPR